MTAPPVYAGEPLVGRFGDLHFPVEASTVDTTLTQLDPAKARLAGLFKAATNAELGDVWTKVTNAMPVGHPLRGRLPVQDVLEVAPTPTIMQQRHADFPLMCLYRNGKATTEQFTLFIDKATQTWGLDYILGPMDAGDLRKTGDICIAVVKVLRSIIRRRGHESYDNGALQFFPDKGGLASIELKDYEGPGQAVFAGDEKGTMYYALSMTLETTENLYDDSEEFGAFDAVDFEVGVGSLEGIVPGMIYASTDVPIVEG